MVMEARRRKPGDPPPLYGSCDELFSLEIHHDGFFCGVGKNQIYIDDKVDWFDFCESDTCSLLWVQDFLQQLGYDEAAYSKLRAYWCVPGKTVADGLRSLKGDSDMVDIIAASTVEKNLVLFIDHVNFLETNRHDDVLVDGMRDLPAVIISPVKRSRNNIDDEDEVGVISPVKKRKQRYASKRNEDEEEVEASWIQTFVDSDYEIGKDDDDLKQQPKLHLKYCVHNKMPCILEQRKVWHSCSPNF